MAGPGARLPDLLIYHEDHQALVCCRHGYALPNLGEHLRRQHAELNGTERRAIAAQFAGLQLQPLQAADFRHDRPQNPRAPIAGLTVHRGFPCDYDSRCRFRTTSFKKLKVHRNRLHGVKGAKGHQGLRPKAVWIQT